MAGGWPHCPRARTSAAVFCSASRPHLFGCHRGLQVRAKGFPAEPDLGGKATGRPEKCRCTLHRAGNNRLCCGKMASLFQSDSSSRQWLAAARGRDAERPGVEGQKDPLSCIHLLIKLQMPVYHLNLSDLPRNG